MGSYFSRPDVPGRVITTLGRSSLFVYWIHVEMAYGGIARPLKRALPLELSLVATVALCALLYKIVRVERSQDGRAGTDGRVANLRAGLEVIPTGILRRERTSTSRSRGNQNASRYVIFAITAREISAPLRESCRSL